jgi:hypothetical protein
MKLEQVETSLVHVAEFVHLYSKWYSTFVSVCADVSSTGYEVVVFLSKSGCQMVLLGNVTCRCSSRDPG